MDKSTDIGKSLIPPTLPKWWRILPSLSLLVMIATVDTLILNDFVQHRYASQYETNSSKTANIHELCLNSTRTSHNSTQILSTTTSKLPRTTTMSPTDRIQEATAKLNVYISFASTVPAILTSVLLGSNCDIIGRKPLVVLPYVGKCIRYIFFTAIAYYNLTDIWIVLGIMFDGIFGTLGLNLLSTFAYVSDCTSKEQRTRAIIITEVCIIISRVVPLFSMGLYLQNPNYTAAMLFILFISIVGLIISIVLQPESNLSVQHLNIFQQLARIKIRETTKIFRVFLVKREGNKQRSLIMLISAHLLIVVMLIGSINLNYLYLYGPPFCMDSFGVSLTTGAQTIAVIIYTIIFTYVIPKGNDHLSRPILGTLAYIICITLYGIANQVWMIYVAICCGGLCYVLIPVIRSYVFKTVESSEYASVFLLASIVESGGTFAINAMGNEIYQSTLDIYSGFTYFVFALFGVLSIILLLYVLINLVLRIIKNIICFSRILSALKYRTLRAQQEAILLND